MPDLEQELQDNKIIRLEQIAEGLGKANATLVSRVETLSKEKIALELANAALQAQVAVLKEIILGAL